LGFFGFFLVFLVFLVFLFFVFFQLLIKITTGPLLSGNIGSIVWFKNINEAEGWSHASLNGEVDCGGAQRILPQAQVKSNSTLSIVCQE
jgi:hypothetical protein